MRNLRDCRACGALNDSSAKLAKFFSPLLAASRPTDIQPPSMAYEIALASAIALRRSLDLSSARTLRGVAARTVTDGVKGQALSRKPGPTVRSDFLEPCRATGTGLKLRNHRSGSTPKQ
jgi:hypothetical protein